MKYVGTTNTFSDGRIEQILEVDVEGMRTQLWRRVMHTTDEGIRKALIELGWTPPPTSTGAGRETGEQVVTDRPDGQVGAQMSAQERTRPSTPLQVLPAPPKVVTVVHEDGLFLGCLEGGERDRTAERLIEARIKSRARTGKIYTFAHYYRIGDVRTFEKPSE